MDVAKAFYVFRLYVGLQESVFYVFNSWVENILQKKLRTLLMPSVIFPYPHSRA
jgi:hypothetical protein